MFVKIRAVTRENFPGVWTPGRFWPSAETLRVEVVDSEPPMLDEPIFHEGKQTGTRKVPDSTKISRATFDELKADGRITILADGETDETISKTVLDAAKKTATDATDKVAALEKEIAELKDTNQALAAHIVELEHAQPPAVSDDEHTGKHSKGKR
jgi:FtsZ-binding cell division protein ZapB